MNVALRTVAIALWVTGCGGSNADKGDDTGGISGGSGGDAGVPDPENMPSDEVSAPAFTPIHQRSRTRHFEKLPAFDSPAASKSLHIYLVKATIFKNTASFWSEAVA